ncbi:MAG: glycosyltransferase [Anaerolineaceae bacterium]|nr:glycosyltransferase [Anaerolineaceae bacterium]
MTETLSKISIITPSFQQAAFLEQTMKSVLEQGYANLEYIVIDGGSTDSSVEQIKKVQSQLAYWVSEADQGQAHAINKGLQKASGEIIGWINSDDYYLPRVLNQVADVFQENPDIGLVYGDVLAVDGNGKPINVMCYAPWTVKDLLQFRIIGQSSVFFRRETLQKSGLLDAQYHYLLDHHLWIRMAAQTKMVYVPQIWSAARYHEQAKNLAEAQNFGKDAQRILLWVENDPAFNEIWQANKRKARAGAAWLNAFYLADAGKYADSLRSYIKVFFLSPTRFLEDWKKFFYVLFCWLNFGFFTKKMELINQQKNEAALQTIVDKMDLE